MRAIIVFAWLAMLAGCATVHTPDVRYQTGHYPDAGERVDATVGNVMVSAHHFVTRATAVPLAAVDGSFWAGRAPIAAGASLVMAVASGQTVYCQVPVELGAPCLIDANNDQRFEKVGTMNAFGRLVGTRNIDPVPFRLDDQTILDGYRYELIYQGVDAGVARIAYREYFANLARPDHAQDLTYTLAADGDTDARFRDVHLTIHAADNSTITYTVNAGFGAAP